MADISRIVLPDGDSYNLKDIQARSNRFFSVNGTQTVATSSWTGSLPIDELTAGILIAYHLPTQSNGEDDVTLTLTLNSGSTGAIPVYSYTNTKLHSTLPAGTTVLLQYVVAGSSLAGGQPNLENQWVITHGMNELVWQVIHG